MGIERDGKLWNVADIDLLESERDDYKHRWETLGRVSGRMIEQRDEQLKGAVEAVRAHYDGWVKANGRASGNMRPADRALWIAVLGPEFGGQ